MTTYSFIQYDVLNNVMSFKGTPTPGLKTLIEDNNSDISSIRDILQNDQNADDTLVPTSASIALINYLRTVTEIDLNKSKTIILTIPIIDDTTIGDTIKIVSKNIDGTKTFVNKPKGSLTLAVELIKPSKKWPTMGKCTNCLKFYFNEFNEYNFTGNLGGVWNGTFKNGQKVYEFYLPDYSSPVGYGAAELYRIYWKPNITYTGTDYNGNPINITNQNKWIATPASTMDVLNDKTFFHALNNLSAPCPYAPYTWYNFSGNKGFFLLNAAQSSPNKPCPVFKPNPGTVIWGFNCGPNGCVEAPSGSIGTWSTLASCSISCSLPQPPASSSYGYNCINGNCIEALSGSTSQYATFTDCEVSCSSPQVVNWYSCTGNGCVQVPSGSAGAVATLAECETYCVPVTSIPTSCSCDSNLNIVTNSNFSQGSANWTYSPLNYSPGIGSFDFSQGYAAPSVEATMSLTGTSSVYLTQPNIFNISCSYNICFQAWVGFPVDNALISVDNGNNLTQGTGPLTTTPTAYSFTLNNVATTDLTFFFGMGVTGSGARMNIDNICVTLIGCPPVLPPLSGSEGTGSVTPPSSDCFITGSIYSYTTASYDCICPEGYVSDGSGSCTNNGTVLIVSASAGIYPVVTTTSSNSNWTYNGDYILGFSINQPDPFYSVTAFPTNGSIPALVGMAQPILYYSWSFNGTGKSSTGSISPFSGSSRVYNTQYTFDILKNNFWHQPDLGQNWTARWVAQLARQTTLGLVGGGATLNERWSGFGTTLNVPTNKTYYVGIIGQGAMKIKLDGTTILCTSPTETSTPNYSQTDYPAYAQNWYARYPQYPSGSYNWGTLPAPFYSLNNKITSSISSSYFDWYAQSPGSEYAYVNPPITSGITGKFLSGYNLFLYPVTMSAGCHKINFESNPDYFKYCNSQQGFLGAIILDNTATQLVSASSYNDLNIVWDSTYLDSITQSMVYDTNSNYVSRNYYMYAYDVATTPLSSSYISACPSGSTAISGSPCLGCLKSGSLNSTVPCGNCLECTHGLLYNGYVVDKGGATLQGRGPGGIVNTGSVNASTWVVPTESDWNNLVTFLNNGTAPTNVTITGSLGTIAGGKMKDYTRDLEATCWESPNLGAQTNVSSSGWAGTAGGRRKDDGTFEGLGFEGLWWSANSLSTPPVTNGALMAVRRLEHYSPDVYRDIFPKSYGCSIRLVRPAVTGEVNGMFIPDAYVGKNGTIYDGIVINDQVWIDKNLSETLYNNSAAITNTIPNSTWSSTTPLATATSCFYGNNSNNANILNGNVNPVTQECYTFPTYYVYQKCDGTEFISQTVSGSTTTVGKVQKDSNGDCWSFYQTSTGLPTFTPAPYIGNYFSGSNVVYNNCSECEAIHTIYMKFGTKNC
jgi:hypothetical protein